MYNAKASVKVEVTCGKCKKEGEISLPMVWDKRLNLATIETSEYRQHDEWYVAFSPGFYDEPRLEVTCPDCNKPLFGEK